MGIVFCNEIMKARSQSGSYQDSYEYVRAWVIRTDATDTPMSDITNAAGVAWLAAHPDNESCKAVSFDTTCADDSGLVYIYKVTYRRPPVDANDDEGGGGLMKIPTWSGSSSTRTVPAIADKNGNPIANSAGDPLEDVTYEITEPRLTLTEYVLNHTDVLSRQASYTDTVNSDSWNGGAARTWRCLGCSFRLQSENAGETTVVFWEVNWEFAYKGDTWDLHVWDIGFAQLVDGSGTPSMAGDKRAVIVGQDKKPVRQPVALAGGVAKPAGEPPDELTFEMYEPAAFGTAFGEVYTPGL